MQCRQAVDALVAVGGELEADGTGVDVVAAQAQEAGPFDPVDDPTALWWRTFR